jgi:hypothetical protein
MSTAFAIDIRLGTRDYLFLGQTISSFQNLIVLDNSWTGITATRQHFTGEDEAVLTTLVGSILQDLERARSGASWLQDFVVKQRIENLREAARVAAEALPEDIASIAQDVDDVFGTEFGALTENCYSSLRDGLREQRSTLVSELAGLLSGERSDGDLFKNILCGIAGGMTIGGLIATAVPPHITGPAIVVSGATALKAFKCDLDELAMKSKWRLVY